MFCAFFAIDFACGAEAPVGGSEHRVTVAFAALLTTGNVTVADEPFAIAGSVAVVVAVVERGIEFEAVWGGPTKGVAPPPPPQATSVAAISASAATP